MPWAQDHTAALSVCLPAMPSALTMDPLSVGRRITLAPGAPVTLFLLSPPTLLPWGLSLHTYRVRLLSKGRHHEILLTGGLKQKTLLSHGSGDWTVQVEVPAD